ncbi:putative membrane protein [Vibrio chagasii]|nr:putative membrane protein [Vibrio chagasii]CDT87047.1 putative membrane protein [Vibrio coralliirubri]CAH6840155.1 putative membrane protein [Vibrio chagasii]CAH6842044.1 putative membrane protein [Vibrio chagasii]CAH7064940.1 putative membrane protein [Vibrio chagasii]
MIFYIYSYFSYILFEYVFRKKLFKHACRSKSLHECKWKKGKEHWLLFSPGYWFARYYKNKIKLFCPEAEAELRKSYLKSMNAWNLWITVAISVLYLVLSNFEYEFVQVFAGFLLFRFFSRMLEVSYAFVSDVLSQKNRSNLSRYERVRLASSSYIELFFLSAPVYLIFNLVCDPLTAFTASLSVGTLTNVGFLVQDRASILVNIAFVQVLVTMSLIIFSLAMYLSREK